jgi:hypothetical protein
MSGTTTFIAQAGVEGARVREVPQCGDRQTIVRGGDLNLRLVIFCDFCKSTVVGGNLVYSITL